MIDNLGASGTLKYEIIDVETGEVLESHEQKNLVVTAGLNLIRLCFNSGTGTSLTHFGLGSGVGSDTAAAAAQTDLQGATKNRYAVTSKDASTDGTLVVQYYLGSATENGNTIKEAGIFTAASAGTMYNRVVFGTPIVKTASVAVSFVWTLTWAAA